MRPRGLLLTLALPVFVHAGTQFDIVGPPGSDSFGTAVVVLPNGNFVVTDPDFDQPSPALTDNGAVYLYSSEGLLISTLIGGTSNNKVGNNGVTVLANGNFVVRSILWDNGAATDAGAVTWGSATTGFIGGASVVVSTSNSVVGSTANDVIGSGSFTALPNGNYVTGSTGWDNGAAVNAGAVTWGDGNNGTVGAVSGSNSLVGSASGDTIGNNGITVLTNGNYVVASPAWRNPAGGITGAGAATWGNASTGVSGAASATNSLVGTTVNDFVGISGITALTNGNYVVRSSNWDNGGVVDAGAATWGNGQFGVTGAISAANSLVGTTLSDGVAGSSVVALANGNYVVLSTSWDSTTPPLANAGAATWGNGSTGTAGPVSATNSLVGSTASDNIGQGAIALTNGNYVVLTPNWDNPTPVRVNAGAATWGNGTTGIKGVVSPANSLVGAQAFDLVGRFATPLTNGNYVVVTGDWDNPSPVAVNAGAATWGNGTTGIKGFVSSSNSLVGTHANDGVGSVKAVALTNGNYVVRSSLWNNDSPVAASAGAVTWGSGTTGIKGPVSKANSLVGGTPNDQVGVIGVIALPNGNYVVASDSWDNPSPLTVDVGAVTWGDGKTGAKGLVSTSNSLFGTSTADFVGNNGVIELTNGNYVVRSSEWDNSTPAAINAGAITWGNGLTGVIGPVLATNSLVGSSFGDRVSNSSVTRLDNGNYLFRTESWDNPSPVIIQSGTVSLGNGAVGSVGLVGASNSVLGTVVSGGSNLSFGYDSTRHQMIVGRKDSNIVSRFIDSHIRSLAITNTPAPGALDIAFATPGSTAVNADGAALSDFTLSGAGAAGGKNRAIFAVPAVSGSFDLVMRSGDLISALGGGLPFDAKVTALSSLITQQPNRALFEVTATGAGINASNNRLLLMDNGIGVSLLHRTGQPIGSLGNASISKFTEVLQGYVTDDILVSYQLKPGTAPAVNSSNDSGVLFLNHSGLVIPTLPIREGASAAAFVPLGGTFGQFSGRAAIGTTFSGSFTAIAKPIVGPAVPAVFTVTSGGNSFSVASVGAAAPGAPGTTFSSFPALSQMGPSALFKATLKGSPAATSEGLWRQTSLLLRKGDDVNTLNLPGIKIAKIIRFWPAGSTQIIVLAQLSDNSQALILHQADTSNFVLLRTGQPAPGVSPAKLLAISAVDVHPTSGRYAVLGTLKGAASNANQALWTGNPALGNDTTLQPLRTPALSLRKGQTYTTENTPQSTIRSIIMKTAVDATGAGGRGLAQSVSGTGSVALFILGDRSITELVMLQP